MKHHIILRIGAKLLIPLIMLLALYVQFHGDYGPGGGFQAGVIFASAFILYGLVFGLGELRRVAPLPILMKLMAAGWLIYIGTGYLGLALGGMYLDYNILSSDPVAGQHLGIFLIELAVGITVASTMLAIYQCFNAHQSGEMTENE
ncbi:MAG: multicomponent Na+:H+ antiporter subunit B [Alphaproteobacteria bacterium]|nr:multicomponent Na+:H+ antiporter subunit B [Alphaproteobacteria bacterium]